MSVYKSYECNKSLCKDCSRKHNDKNKYQSHLMQLISDSFILNCKFSLEDDFLSERIISDIKCLPNGKVIVAVYEKREVMTFSVSGKQRRVIQLEYSPKLIDVVDKHTVAVLLIANIVTIIDIQQNHVQYIRDAVAFKDFSYLHRKPILFSL
ncbi:unnamed protein product [Mytilus coruscus]|uniref:B box-type domain-containing protein n=1 Tax=Mytilus coruscus TaxID=42192 RepID=A0A6J8DTR6_MYTCO|nr:unnamed protein product [Mytilus coruscus]